MTRIQVVMPDAARAEHVAMEQPLPGLSAVKAISRDSLPANRIVPHRPERAVGAQLAEIGPQAHRMWENGLVLDSGAPARSGIDRPVACRSFPRHHSGPEFAASAS